MRKDRAHSRLLLANQNGPPIVAAPWRRATGWIALVTAAALATLVSAAVIEIQAGTTAYITGEGHWSGARLETIYRLQKYAESGNPDELRKARKALEVPLGDRMARLAMEQSPIDEAKARTGFLAGRNAEADVPRLIRTYRYFGRTPFFMTASGIWRQADPYVLELRDIADQLEMHWRTPGAGPAPAGVTIELDRIGSILGPLERSFAETLRIGVSQVREALLVVSGLLFLVIAWLAWLAYRMTLREVRLAESRFRAAFQQSSVGMVKLGVDGMTLAVNEEFVALMRQPAQALVGRHFDDHFDAPSQHRHAWWEEQEPLTQILRRADGTSFWGRVTPSPVEDVGGGRRVFLIVEDVSEAHELALTLADQASHDALTGLINRREIETRLKAAIAQVQTEDVRHTLCLLDLDQFKVINDTCTHAAGDEVLRLVSMTLPTHLGERDWIGRLGGDEFAILLYGVELDRATVVANELKQVLANTYLLWDGRHFPATASVGLVEINSCSPGVDWLLRAADTACYMAKDGGRNSVRVYVEGDREISRRHSEMAWVNQLRAAIAEERLELHAQKIVDLRDNAGGTRYEILVRMIDPNGVVCYPTAFLPAAERYGLAPAIDEQVLSMTLRMLAECPVHLERLEACHLNVSVASATSPDFRARAMALLDAYPGIAPRLCFELNEAMSIDRLPQLQAFIAAVRERGCLLALDDFGNGLSSFAYLRNLQVDILKIDGLFVRGIDGSDLDRAIVQAIVSLGRSQGMRIIAEWVESDAVRECLAEMGVDAAQGYAIHKPGPLRELIEFRVANGAHARGS